jgi:hypothetical protein
MQRHSLASAEPRPPSPYRREEIDSRGGIDLRVMASAQQAPDMQRKCVLPANQEEGDGNFIQTVEARKITITPTKDARADAKARLAQAITLFSPLPQARPGAAKIAQPNSR